MARQLLEGSVAYSKPAEIDAVNGIIKGVKLCGTESANKRRYPLPVLQKNLAKYANAPVYFAHSDKDRDFWEQAGQVMSNPRMGPDGVYGDVQCLMKDPHVQKFFEAAEKMPSTIGMSHSAAGDGHYEGETLVVDDLEEVFSVDIVTRPATTKGLFESKGAPVAKTIKLKALLEKIEPRFKGNRPKWLKKLREDDTAAPAAMGADVPDPGDEGGSAEDMLKKGFRAAIEKILDDDGLDLQTKISQIKEIMKTEEKMLQKDDPAPPSDSGSSDTPTAPTTPKEGRPAGDANLQERVERFEKRDRLEVYAESVGYKIPRDLWEDLLPLGDDAAKRLILRESKHKAAPRSGPPGRTDEPAKEAPKTKAEFKEGIFSR